MSQKNTFERGWDKKTTTPSVVMPIGDPQDGIFYHTHDTVVPTKSDSDVVFCFLFLSKTLTCTIHLS